MSKTKQNMEKLHGLVYTLFYPAVLGTLFMLVVMGLSESKLEVLSLRFGYALFLVLYFSIQHIQNIKYNAQKYNKVDLLSDCLELITMFFLFLYLGITKEASETNWHLFYMVLGITFALPVVARAFKMIISKYKPTKDEKWLSILSIAAMAATWLFAACYALNILGLLYVLFVIYLLIFVLPIPKSPKHYK